MTEVGSLSCFGSWLSLCYPAGGVVNPQTDITVLLSGAEVDD